MQIVFVILISYLLGCIPTAYIIVKYFTKQDITKLGTGNIGAMNTYESTNKKRLGIYTLLGDFLKGAAAVIISNRIIKNNEPAIVLSALFCIIGHNYNIFLKFKGGRGLATAAAVLALINPQLLIYWLLIWIVSKFLLKEIHTANIISTVLSPILVLFAFHSYLNSAYPVSETNYILLSFATSVIILLGHSR